ncbi:SAGA complex subunit-like protein [Hapsidospora chrysogenum ATCC 11550]|uniref:SAGA complex subunit-like protein n=1 Tax=Hapsidospora chrysogenum (strain ATCC 11550 / CBS 779.69 / DSM 880 / IAM 14645 / JCM 23072 / IMI 49137) TaxID=857340 RepID=A0A086TGF2_HAPC1|nr:SAGA complex subunit-like protein [Hapsidospora chrysogenum ATCC 11550]
MAPVGAQPNGLSKVKRPAPPGIQTSDSLSTPLSVASKPVGPAKSQPYSASERTITASTVRPVNRTRRESTMQLGRNSRNSARLRSGFQLDGAGDADGCATPQEITSSYVLKNSRGKPPSLVVHLHQTYFRFDGQEGMFTYRSAMSIFIEHLRAKTIPHDILENLIQAGVPFYYGCLIVQVYDHRTTTQTKDASRPKSSTPVSSSINKFTPYLTPSPFAPFPKDEQSANDVDGKVAEDESKKQSPNAKIKQNLPSSGQQPDNEKAEGEKKPKVFTVVLHPTPESLRRDLIIKATTPASKNEAGVNPPSTPASLVPPTPTTSMPPPGKRQKAEKTELDPRSIQEAEGQILVATQPTLFLTPRLTLEEMIATYEVLAPPEHSQPPPQPKTRKRTVAEMAADEAAAAEQERYMLVLDERGGATGSQITGGTDADGQAGGATFEPTFERFKVIEDIKQEHAERKEQEKLKQQENDRRLQVQKEQQAQQQQAQQQQAQKQQNEAEKARREAAAMRERHAEAQRQAAAARAAASTPGANANKVNTGSSHAHPSQAGANIMGSNTMGGQANGTVNGVGGQAQARFQAQMAQAPASSPVVRHGTPQSHSSPMVNNSVPMQQTSSAMAASPPRPSSVVQNPPMSVPMAHNMSARGSQQSHPSGTPRMPHSTPNMAHGTPINRQAMAGTPRMTQASSPPNMMAQMGQNAMMNNGTDATTNGEDEPDEW